MKEICNKIKFIPWPHYTMIGNIALVLIDACAFRIIGKHIFGSLTTKYLGTLTIPGIGLGVNVALTIGFLVS